MERMQPRSSILHIRDLDQANRENYSFILRDVREEELEVLAADITTSEIVEVHTDVPDDGIHQEGSELVSDDDPFADFNFREQDPAELTAAENDGNVLDRTAMFQQVTHSLPRISHAMAGLAEAVGQTACACGVDHSASVSHTTFEPARPRHLEVVKDEPKPREETPIRKLAESSDASIIDELAQRRQLRRQITEAPTQTNLSNTGIQQEPIQAQPSAINLTKMQKCKNAFKRIAKRITTFIKEKIFRRPSNVQK